MSESPELWKAITMRRRTLEALDNETAPGIPHVRYWNRLADIALRELESSDLVKYMQWVSATENSPAAIMCVPG